MATPERPRPTASDRSHGRGRQRRRPSAAQGDHRIATRSSASCSRPTRTRPSRYCSKSVPGVILLDVEMPRMDGLTFLRKLMRQHPMPVVLCTDQAERAVTALEMGAIEVIAKPDWRDPPPRWRPGPQPAGKHPERRPRRPLADARREGTRDRLPGTTADAVLPKLPLHAPRRRDRPRRRRRRQHRAASRRFSSCWQDFRPTRPGS